MKRSLLFILICMLTTIASAGVSLQLDRDSIASDQVLTLTIASSDHLSISPDLEPLKKDFYVVGTSQNSQFNIINGVTQMETQWQIALLPKHSGDIVIPALQVGQDNTSSRLVHVLNLKKDAQLKQKQNHDIFIESSVISKEPYIQEQLVYTLKLYYRQSIENPYLMGPELAGAKIAQNGQDIIYTTVKNGKYYRVLERSYIITPAAAGSQTIQPPLLKGYINEQGDMMAAYGFSSHSLKPIKVVGSSLDITVKPKPANLVGQWLPAKKVVMSERWEPSTPVFREGEPVTRIVEIVAFGTTGDQIPDMVMTATPNVNWYPEKPKKETTISSTMQVGKLTQKIVFIPTHSGKVTLPAMQIRWWNSTTKKPQVSLLPAETINVMPALFKTASATKPAVSSLARSSSISANKRVQESSVGWKNSIWPVIASLILMVWLLTLWLWRRQVKVGTIWRTKVKRQSLPDLQKQLKEACATGNSRLARTIFLIWAVVYWQDNSLHALTDIINKLQTEHDHALAASIMELEAVFYSRRKQQWDGMSFWTCLMHYLKAQGAKMAGSKIDPLPPLYCSES